MRLFKREITILPQWIIRIRAGLLDRIEAWGVARHNRRVFYNAVTEAAAEKMAADMEDAFLNGTGAGDPFVFDPGLEPRK